MKMFSTLLPILAMFVIILLVLPKTATGWNVWYSVIVMGLVVLFMLIVVVRMVAKKE
jgi:hypothetical protein